MRTPECNHLEVSHESLGLLGNAGRRPVVQSSIVSDQSNILHKLFDLRILHLLQLALYTHKSKRQVTTNPHQYCIEVDRVADDLVVVWDLHTISGLSNKSTQTNLLNRHWS